MTEKYMLISYYVHEYKLTLISVCYNYNFIAPEIMALKLRDRIQTFDALTLLPQL